MSAPETPVPGKTYIERVAARAGVAGVTPATVARVLRALRDEPLPPGVKYGRALNFHMTLANAIHEHAVAVNERATAAARDGPGLAPSRPGGGRAKTQEAGP